jgi:hypothetical protein
LNNAGIRTYGVSGLLGEEVSGVHGLNERLAIKALYESQEFLYRLTKVLSSSVGSSRP